MIDKTKMDTVVRLLAVRAETDVVGPWLVWGDVLEEMPELTKAEAKVATLAAIRTCLQTGAVVAGEFVDYDEETLSFTPWSSSTDETISRMDREWTALGRDPNLMDLGWLVDPRILPLRVHRYPMGKGWKPGDPA